METVTGFIFLGSKITMNNCCSHEIKRLLLLGKKVMRTKQCIKRKGISLPTKILIVKTIVFPVVMYRCESWAKRKAEH